MQIIQWKEIEKAIDSDYFHPFFKSSCGISIGSFDGLHKGHRLLLNTLVNKSKELKILSGVVSFERPLPSFKHSEDYLGDLTSLDQRLKLFEELGLDFVILVNFNDKFASIKGIEFLQMLVDACNMKYIAEGIDFRCGYKGATDTNSIKYFAENNGIKYDFVEAVYYSSGTEEERISSSFIRTMVLKRFFSTIQDLLERPYSVELDINSLEFTQKIEIQKNTILQILPPNGIYHCNSNYDEIRVEILENSLILDILNFNKIKKHNDKIIIEFL